MPSRPASLDEEKEREREREREKERESTRNIKFYCHIFHSLASLLCVCVCTQSNYDKALLVGQDYQEIISTDVVRLLTWHLCIST